MDENKSTAKSGYVFANEIYVCCVVYSCRSEDLENLLSKYTSCDLYTFVQFKFISQSAYLGFFVVIILQLYIIQICARSYVCMCIQDYFQQHWLHLSRAQNKNNTLFHYLVVFTKKYSSVRFRNRQFHVHKNLYSLMLVA